MTRQIPATKRAKLLAEMNGRCGYCGTHIELTEMQVDHRVPKRRGGSDDHDNLIASCRPCNNLKGVYTIEEFRDEIASQVSRARKYSVNFRTAERFNLVAVTAVPVIFYFEAMS